MDGATLAKICDAECLKRGMSKADFYAAIGLSAASFHGWKNGAKPSQKYIDAIEKLFGIELSVYERAEPQDESAELREMLRDRTDLRVLLNSAKDVPPSSVYALISQLEKMKEDST